MFAETSYGYKDNLLLSAMHEERSAFLRSGAEVFLLRLPDGPFEASFYTGAELTHFFTSQTVENAKSVFVLGDAGYRIADRWKLNWTTTGYYQDEVFDASRDEFERSLAEIKVRGAILGPSLRWSFHPRAWVEAQANGERKRYVDHAADGDVGSGSVRLGWMLHRKIEARLIATRRWRSYEHRLRYNAAGFPLTGTELKIAEREGELRFDVTWDDAGRWRTITRAAIMDYADNGSGFFNYRERRVGNDVEWRGERWSLRLGGTARRKDFEVQTVGFGIDPPARLKDEFSAEFRLERKLGSRWAAFLEYAWERVRANDTIASYEVNEGLLGARWSWER